MCRLYSPDRRFLKLNHGTLPAVAGHRTKWDEDNASPINPWAIGAAVGLILVVVGLAVLFALT
jgi:hypothetical protein